MNKSSVPCSADEMPRPPHCPCIQKCRRLFNALRHFLFPERRAAVPAHCFQHFMQTLTDDSSIAKSRKDSVYCRFTIITAAKIRLQAKSSRHKKHMLTFFFIASPFAPSGQKHRGVHARSARRHAEPLKTSSRLFVMPCENQQPPPDWPAPAPRRSPQTALPPARNCRQSETQVPRHS